MPRSRQVSPEILALSNYLRSVVSSEDAIAIERRVQVFQGKQALAAILDSSYSQRAGKHAPSISTSDIAKQYIKKLIASGVIIKASVKGTKIIPLTAFQQAAAQNGSNPPQPSKILVVEPDPSFTWEDDAYYIWIYSGNQIMTYIKSFLLLIFVFVMVMYPLWPYQLRAGSWYVAMLGVSLVGVLFATALLRIILYCITRAFGQGLWIFPNLFEDCGFFESFVPLYSWEIPGSDNQKNIIKND